MNVGTHARTSGVSALSTSLHVRMTQQDYNNKF